MNEGKTVRWKNVMLKNISGGYCMIVGRKDEILLHNPHLVVLDGTGTETENDTESQYKGSGYVILFLGKLLRKKVISHSIWGKDKQVWSGSVKQTSLKETPRIMDPVATTFLLETEPIMVE